MAAVLVMQHTRLSMDGGGLRTRIKVTNPRSLSRAGWSVSGRFVNVRWAVVRPERTNGVPVVRAWRYAQLQQQHPKKTFRTRVLYSRALCIYVVVYRLRVYMAMAS
jgi:hypothetical protein